MFLNQGTRQPEASQEEEKVNGDMAEAWEELDDVQLATVVGGSLPWLSYTLRELDDYCGWGPARGGRPVCHIYGM
jgi:hypothetical protein